jgi:hypothetical protein
VAPGGGGGWLPTVSGLPSSAHEARLSVTNKRTIRGYRIRVMIVESLDPSTWFRPRDAMHVSVAWRT